MVWAQNLLTADKIEREYREFQVKDQSPPKLFLKDASISQRLLSPAEPDKFGKNEPRVRSLP
jgi:hypothetical protein